VADASTNLVKNDTLSDIGLTVSAMLFAALAGYFFWGEVPVMTAWIGAGVIATCGLFIFMRRNKINRSAAPVEPVVIE